MIHTFTTGQLFFMMAVTALLFGFFGYAVCLFVFVRQAKNQVKIGQRHAQAMRDELNSISGLTASKQSWLPGKESIYDRIKSGERIDIPATLRNMEAAGLIADTPPEEKSVFIIDTTPTYEQKASFEKWLDGDIHVENNFYKNHDNATD